MRHTLALLIIAFCPFLVVGLGWLYGQFFNTVDRLLKR